LALTVAAAAQCRVKTQEATRSVPWAASAGEVLWTTDQPGCQPTPVLDKNIPWVAITVMPPTTAFASSGVFRYSVDSNLTPETRKASIKLGDASIEISQAAGPKPGLFFSPGRMEMQFTPSPQAPKEITKTLFVGSEEPLPYTAKIAEPADWVSVSPGEVKTPQREQKFVVTVKTEKLKPGTNKASIQLGAVGASNTTETIPVVVQVGGLNGSSNSKL